MESARATLSVSTRLSALGRVSGMQAPESVGLDLDGKKRKIKP
jgi:hypothetical protein